jgi:DNA repair protein RecO (recombination protein O)
MQWTDEGFVLSARRHGETSSIVNLLSREHGRHVGLVRGGASSRQRGTLQSGNLVSATWRARLEEHLGTFTVEPLLALAAGLLDQPGPLAALISVCALIESSLPEREPHPQLFHDLSALIGMLDGPDWCIAYGRWELALLTEVGFGLDLSACASTGRNDDLIYVSPKSGRAVSALAGEPYRDRLLPLPEFLVSSNTATTEDLVAGLQLTGFFIERHIFSPHAHPLPDARARLLRYIAEDANKQSQ